MCIHVESLSASSAPQWATLEECSKCYVGIDGVLHLCVHCGEFDCLDHLAIHQAVSDHPVSIRIQAERRVSLWCAQCDAVQDQQGWLKELAATLAVGPATQPEVKFEEEQCRCEHVENLVQFGKGVSSVCDKCSFSTNLWVCLVCGHVGCGRQSDFNPDSKGHAVLHFNESQHAASAKLLSLSTRSATFGDEVHCYICDGMRLDPLAGIRVQNLGWTLPETAAEPSLRDQQVLMAIESDTKEESLSARPSMVGLENPGNACFIGAVLQCVAHIPAVVEATGEHMCSNRSDWCLDCQTAKIMRGLARDEPREFGGLSLRMFRGALGRMYDFPAAMQHDAHEFLVVWMELLADRGLASVFEGTVRDLTDCTRNDNPSENVIEFKCMSVDSGCQYIGDAFAPTTIQRDCGCGSDTAIQNHQILRMPRVLAVQIQRFTFEGGGMKVDCSPVLNPDDLDIGGYAAEGVEGLYRLVSFVEHVGVNVHAGHYKAYVRAKYCGLDEEGWIQFNDLKVTRTDSPPFEKAYLVFYEKIVE